VGDGEDTIALCEKPRIHFRFFLTCFAFLSISVILRPLSCYIYKLFKGGIILARNIEILDDDGAYKQKNYSEFAEIL